ncbi:Fe-Mn family superoxide dismutase [Aciditerrimonas ferrireducens]|jgi:Fe-Mn family superoxide dismutase|uniref:Fe-Mn family superoxide dismutase n=1 Tax=Aciditerrimonas ferrireducens TaxID=667306 RepID=A0ABV6C0N4_9ACTN|nr:Fe-Mn family superoxide dismutase [Aciditerrimonas ferrireducens]
MVKELIAEQLSDHHANLARGLVAMWDSDVGEHASYLQYRNIRADFIGAPENVVSRSGVAARFISSSRPNRSR